MSMKPALALMAVEVAQDLEAQDLEDQGVAEEDMAEEDAISKRHSDIRTVAIISSM